MNKKRRLLVHRLPRQRGAEAGLTLIELLISLMLLMMITGFLAGGLAIARRAFAADQTAATEAANASALDSLRDLIATALPTKIGPGAQIAFEGGHDNLAFIGLSAGHALPGGPVGVRIYRNGSTIAVAAKLGAEAEGARRETNITAVTGVTAIEFSYFGSLNDRPAAWHLEWPVTDHLPDVVAIRVGFSDRSRVGPALVVALRQS
jgi:general secretion pathway protein J